MAHAYHTTALGPVGLWQLAGDLLDSSGNGFTLSHVLGTSAWTDILPGMQGMWFDSGHLIQRSTYEAALHLLGDMTIEAIVTIDRFASSGAATDWATIASHTGIGSTAAENSAFRFAIREANGRFAFLHEHDTQVAEEHVVDAALPIRTVAHVACVRKDNTVQFYMNGVRMGSVSATFTAPDSGTSGRFIIGGRGHTGGTTGQWLGPIASVKLFNYALTEDQIRSEALATGFLCLADAAPSTEVPADTFVVEGVVEAAIAPTVVHDEGGYEVVGGILNASLPNGDYFIRVGTEDGPQCYSGVSGQGDIVTIASGAFSFVTPPLTAGGPYRLFFIDVASGVSQRTAELLTVVPFEFRNRIAGIRRSTVPIWRVGWRRPNDT